MRCSHLLHGGRATSVVLCVTIGAITGCRSTGEEGPQPPPAAVEFEARAAQTREQGQAEEKELRGLSVAQLEERLEQDSVQLREPFNSAPYRELRRRGPQSARELAGAIKTVDPRYFLSLVALHQLDPEGYAQVDPALRVEILVQALERSPTFNTWGLPHLYWEQAARALVANGERAIPSLRKLLTDKRAAPVWGSEEALESQAYGYRVCDYAWALILTIRKLELQVPRDPAARDQGIAEELAR